jgi:hypothetical protein
MGDSPIQNSGKPPVEEPRTLAYVREVDDEYDGGNFFLGILISLGMLLVATAVGYSLYSLLI